MEIYDNGNGTISIYHKGESHLTQILVGGKRRRRQVKVGDVGTLVYILGVGFELRWAMLESDSKGCITNGKRLHYGYIGKTRRGGLLYAGGRVEVTEIIHNNDGWEIVLCLLDK